MEILALLIATASLLYAVYKINQKLKGVDYETKFFMTRKEFDEIQEQFDMRFFEIRNPSAYDVGQVIESKDGDIIITAISIVKKNDIIMTNNYAKPVFKYQYQGFNKKTQGIELWEE